MIRNIFDGLSNFTANLGNGRDKASHSFYSYTPMSQEALLAAYRGAWLPGKIVDIPADDACRMWRAWNAKPEQISAIEAEEKRLGLRIKLRQALKLARLYGGAALLIGTGDADPSLPLNPETVRRGGIRYLTVLSRFQLVAGDIDLDPTSAGFNKPMFYTVSATARQVRVHPSRVVILIGAGVPSYYDAAEQGWGDSVLNKVYQSMLQADGTSANVASLVFEAKVDTIGVPGLMNRISEANYERQLNKRFSLAETAKGINGTLIHDTEEVVGQKQANFANLPDVMDRFFQNVAGAADIPVTRLFGTSAKGMNATGEGDLKNYYDHIKAMQELDLTPAMYVLDECLIRSALGSRPAEVHCAWSSLWQTTEKERADIGLVTAKTAKTLVEAALFPEATLAEATANALIEVGAMPGLEGAIAEFGMERDEPTEEDDLVALPPQDVEPIRDQRERNMNTNVGQKDE
ncbi:MAG: DUF1073 domain-containing protein [Fuscovulum sp.]|nr:MAG: DUF1073 domain-containing protein [Fuscovulum sp.]